MRLHAISAGDVVRALRVLDARDEAARATIGRVLGFEVKAKGRAREKQTLTQELQASAFHPLWERAIISTMARIRTRSGPPEIEALVEGAAERKPMSSLRLAMTETASGADVLVDTGNHAAGLMRDQARFVNLMRRVLGRDLVSVFRFAGSPLRGVVAELGSRVEEYRPVREGWPVVVLSDFGATSEWKEFSRVVKAAGCHLIALVPHAPARWPAGLAASMRLVPWDRSTSVRSIKSALRGLDRG